MRSVTIYLPDSLELSDTEIKLLLAGKLYERGELSLGYAAELAGLRKRTFIELLGKYNVSVFNFSASELCKEINNTTHT
ncbi:MAG: hypothetical protein JWO09_79 [Bacteroidetes bacterium]|nr:hypothetical protein [Bacteroidota bacterium]